MCNQLSLIPLEDGLLHRPRANWNIRHLKCQLGPTRIYLCKNLPTYDAEDSSAESEGHNFMPGTEGHFAGAHMARLSSSELSKDFPSDIPQASSSGTFTRNLSSASVQSAATSRPFTSSVQGAYSTTGSEAHMSGASRLTDRSFFLSVTK